MQEIRAIRIICGKGLLSYIGFRKNLIISCTLLTIGILNE